jgi:hypothetical protein
MTLIGKATRQGNIGQRHLRTQQQLAGALDALLQDPAVGRLAYRFLEGADEVAT